MTSSAQLKWRCRRGTKELDYLLESYFEKHFKRASNKEQLLFVELLDLQDSKLIQFLLGDQPPECEGLAKLVNKIRDSSYV